jgi:hypothetical protein
MLVVKSSALGGDIPAGIRLLSRGTDYLNAGTLQGSTSFALRDSQKAKQA